MRNKHSQETKDRAIKLRQKGNSVRAISKECGVSLTILKGWFAEVGLANLKIARGGRRYSQKEQRRILTEYEACKSPRAIVEKYGISKGTLFYWKQLHKTAAKARTGRIYTAGEIASLKKRLLRAERIQRILEHCSCTPKSSLAERVQEVERLKSLFTIHSLCDALHISRASYYRISLQLACNYRTQYERTDEELKSRIQYEFEDSGERFGAPMIQFKLKEKGVAVSEEHVRRLMKEMGLVSKQNRPRCMGNSTHRKYNYRKNHLQRNFTQEKPNIFWVSDVTYARVDRDFYAICVILDLFSRKVLSWQISQENNTDLALDTFRKAYESRNCPDGLTFHSDQGVQYTSYEFRAVLREYHVRQSLSNPGMPHDNAVAEAFFSTFKREELSHNCYQSYEELEKTVREYMGFYNQKRPHRKLDLQTPDQFERNWFEMGVTAGN